MAKDRSAVMLPTVEMFHVTTKNRALVGIPQIDEWRARGYKLSKAAAAQLNTLRAADARIRIAEAADIEANVNDLETQDAAIAAQQEADGQAANEEASDRSEDTGEPVTE